MIIEKRQNKQTEKAIMMYLYVSIVFPSSVCPILDYNLMILPLLLVIVILLCCALVPIIFDRHPLSFSLSATNTNGLHTAAIIRLGFGFLHVLSQNQDNK